MTTRMEHLLTRLADDLEDGRTPLSHEFLVTNAVTADECNDLMNRVAAVLRGYVNAPRKAQLLILAGSVIEAGMGVTAEHIWHVGMHDWAMERAPAPAREEGA
jgi:hypothetical protein